MIIFVDESGTHQKYGQSSVALVYVFVENILEFNDAVCNLEKQLNISGFHWAKHSWKIRSQFLQGLINQDFYVKACLINNPFSEAVFETAIERLLTESKIKKMIIDGKKPIQYVLKLKKVLRKNGLSAEKIRMGNDMSFPGLRVADAFAGLVRAANEEGNY